MRFLALAMTAAVVLVYSSGLIHAQIWQLPLDNQE